MKDPDNQTFSSELNIFLNIANLIDISHLEFHSRGQCNEPKFSSSISPNYHQGCFPKDRLFCSILIFTPKLSPWYLHFLTTYLSFLVTSSSSSSSPTSITMGQNTWLKNKAKWRELLIILFSI